MVNTLNISNSPRTTFGISDVDTAGETSCEACPRGARRADVNRCVSNTAALFFVSTIYAQREARAPLAQTGEVALWAITWERSSLPLGVFLFSGVRQRY